MVGVGGGGGGSEISLFSYLQYKHINLSSDIFCFTAHLTSSHAPLFQSTDPATEGSSDMSLLI